MDYKKAFYSKLEDCYLGVDIKDSEDKSGFTNLLKIKREYFKRIKEYLDNEINNKKDEASDIYNKLYTFFDSYLNETGTPFFNKTENYKNILARIYTNSKDTNLFYKTQNLYYVKSDTIYKSLEIEYDESSTFKFDAEDFIQNSDNTKNKIFFKLDKIYSENNKNTISIKVLNDKTLLEDLQTVFKNGSNEFQSDFLNELDSYKIKYDEDELKKIFFSYKKQMEIDFFIHKDAKTFLEEQFDIWMYNYIYKDSEFQKWNIDTINKLSSIRNIAFRIIDFISKFENELKSIWLKPKFAKNTQYVFTINLILSKASNTNELLKSIFEDKSFDNQIKEWKELNLIDENFNIEKILKNQNLFEEIESKYQYLPIDTKYLSKETKYKLLSSFDNLEEILNGELIKSDNFQALNSIMPKYREKIDLIYIDPPYNSPSSEIIYKNNFKDSTWLTMMENRLNLGKTFLTKKGILTCAIDENEQENLGLLLSSIFYEYEKTCISVKHNTKGIQGGFIAQNNEFAYFISPPKIVSNNKKIKKENWNYDHLRNWGGESERNTAKNCFYPIYVKNNKIIGFGNVCKDDFHPQANVHRNDGITEVYPIDNNGIERKWTYARQSIENIQDDLLVIKDKDGIISIKKPIKEIRFKTIWEDTVYIAGDYGSKILTNIIPNNTFDYPKSIHTVKDSIYLASNQNSIIMDFFAGSGTTAHAVIELNKEGANRKFILVEQGEHFYTVIIPRIKKIAFSSEWKGGKLKNDQQINPVNIAFKYYELESYEEALKNCEYILDENKLIDYGKSRKLIKQLDKTDNAVKLNMTDYRKNFDIFTTMSNLMNLKIKKLYLNNDTEICEFDNGEIISINDLDLKKYPKLQSLIFW